MSEIEEHTTDEFVEAIKQLIMRAGFDSFLVLLVKEEEPNEEGLSRRTADELIGGDYRDIAIGLSVVLERNPMLRLAMALSTQGVKDPYN